MIFLDTCIVRSLDLKDSSADLLRALRAVGERVGIPWMVAEELVAQRVISYRDAHDSAVAALKEVERHTPWDTSNQLEDPDIERPEVLEGNVRNTRGDPSVKPGSHARGALP